MRLFKKAEEESDKVQLETIRIKLNKHISNQMKYSESWVRRLNFLMGMHDILSMREMQTEMQKEVSRNGDSKG